jgi:NAD(P)-dependent dehydrogenase (short-subunit alcohol dehydrogenase family)
VSKGLIIGASSGMGKAIVEYVKTTGIPMCDEWLTPSAEILDVRSSVECHACLRQEGPFDYIVYSAGINQLSWVGHLVEPHSGVFESTWDVNCNGFVRIMSHHEYLYPSAEGSVVAISSDAARRPMRGSVAYCSSKAALDMAVRVMARELAPRWRVNAISPGSTEGTFMTSHLDEEIPLFRGWSKSEAKGYELSQIPMARRAYPEEIAHFTAQVLEGPDYLTGAILEINGGR